MREPKYSTVFLVGAILCANTWTPTYAVSVSTAFGNGADIELTEKVSHVKRHHGMANDWLAHCSNEEIQALVRSEIEGSKAARFECQRYQVAFFDTGSDFDAGIEMALQYLVYR